MAEKKLNAADKKLLAEEKERQEKEEKEKADREALYALFRNTPQFEILNAALKSGNLFHAYFFYGPEGSLKKEAALLFAASILASGDEIIHAGTEDKAKRELAESILRGECSDFIFLDGSRKEAIKKEEIDRIQMRFSHTASTPYGRKAYVIHRFENASIGAMNSLLKFLEEPAGDVYAILTADNAWRILETIRSRCISISFHPLSRSLLEQSAREAGVDEEDVPLIAGIAKDPAKLSELAASADFQGAKRMFRQYLDEEEGPLLYVDYENRYKAKAGSDTSEGVRNKDAKDQNIDMLDWFFGFLMMFYHDALENDDRCSSWYHKSVTRAAKSESTRTLTEKMKIASIARDRVNRNNDLSLLLAQTLLELEECTK